MAFAVNPIVVEGPMYYICHLHKDLFMQYRKNGRIIWAHHVHPTGEWCFRRHES